MYILFCKAPLTIQSVKFSDLRLVDYDHNRDFSFSVPVFKITNNILMCSTLPKINIIQTHPIWVASYLHLHALWIQK